MKFNGCRPCFAKVTGKFPGSVEISDSGWRCFPPSRGPGALKPKGSNIMKTTTTSPLTLATTANVHSLVELTESFGQFCLMAGIESLTRLMNEDVARLAGERHGHCPDMPGCRRGHSRRLAFTAAGSMLIALSGAPQDHGRCHRRTRGRGTRLCTSGNGLLLHGTHPLRVLLAGKPGTVHSDFTRNMT